MKGLAEQLKALGRGLEQFKDSTRRKIVRGGVTKALRRLNKAIKGKVPPNLKDIKKAVGYRLAKATGTDLIGGKVGAGVGIKAKRKEALAAKRQKRREGHDGVGIGPENVHWFILGTVDRTHAGGNSTGRMPAQVPDIIRSGMSSAKGEAFQAMADHIEEGIKKEAAKLDAKIRAAM